MRFSRRWTAIERCVRGNGLAESSRGSPRALMEFYDYTSQNPVSFLPNVPRFPSRSEVACGQPPAPTMDIPLQPAVQVAAGV
jgi:hypothetical protein